MAGVRLNRTVGERWETFLDALAAQGHTRRFRRGMALVLLVAIGMAALALVSWSVDDPSLNHATDGPVTNWMGARGAVFADMAMQLFGLASIAVLVVLLEWARRWMVGAIVPRIGGRALVLLVGLPFVGALLSHLPTPMSWPLPTGLGGVVGDLTDGMIASSLAGIGLPGKISAALALLVAGFALRHASAMRVPLDAVRAMPRAKPEPRVEEPVKARRAPVIHSHDNEDDEDYDETDRSGIFAVAAGGVAHAAISARGAFSRLLKPRTPEFASPGEMSDDSLTRQEPAFTRREPGFAAQTPAFAAPPEPVYAEPAYAEPVYTAPAYEPPGDANAAAPLQSAPQAIRPAPEPTAPATSPVADRDDQAPEPDAEPHQSLAALEVTRPRDFEMLAFDDPDEDEPDAPLADIAPQPTPAPRPVAVAPTPIRPVAPTPAARQAAPAAPVAANDPARAYETPPLDLLSLPGPQQQDPAMSRVQLGDNAQMLEGVLDDFGIRGEIVDVRPGPVVTLYELCPAPGIKSSRVIGLADDIARSMSAISARVAVVPGRNAIGIELPNRNRQTVYLREILEAEAFDNSKARLPMCLGKTIGGEPVVADLARMPHLLIAGTTGSGKSVAVNTMILSLLYRLSPEQCRLIMIDPKMLELSVYDGIPHLLSPVVTDPKKAVVALKWTVREMEDRYRSMSKLGVRNIEGFNQRVKEAAERGEAITRTVQTGFDVETGEPVYETEEMDLKPLPMIVVIVDEMADLMMVAGKDIEGAIQRLAQMARAAGIHLIMATQRPSTDVITGVVKANFPTRISFQVTSKIDSRVVLGEQGAEQLLGQGDMLYMKGGGRISRVHGPFVEDAEVEDVVNHLKSFGAPDYLDEITVDDDEEPAAGGGKGGKSSGHAPDSDDPYDQALSIILRDGKASTSYIQRRLGIGYNRAASIIEEMEKQGIVGPANHAGKREILIDRAA